MRTKFAGLLTLAVGLSVAQMAFAADMAVKARPAPVVASPFWTGFYIGGNVGYSWGSAEADGTVITTAVSDSLDVNGVIGGGQVGYNWQTGNIVLGIEADIQASGQKGDHTLAFNLFVPGVGVVPVTEPYDAKLTYFGTVRGRIGYAFDRWLAYVTGGWAYGHLETSGTAVIAGVSSPFSFSTNRNGWTIGGGVEWGFDRHWSAKLEYLYIDLGDWNIVSSSGGFAASNTVHFTDNIVRLGVNYRF